MICRICGNSENNKAFQIKEMMFGFRDEFTYFECQKCGCLQIAEIPKNMEKYYPINYYSFSKKSLASPIKQRIKRLAFVLGRKTIGKLKFLYERHPILCAISNLNFTFKILDVGCGSGNLLYSLNEIGFKELIGLDPYIDGDIICGDVKILKKIIHELPNDRKFDLIIFNHSFEHIPDQLETLVKVSKILSENGVCLIRMPVKTEYTWNRYGVNWVQIDAPRHFFLHTLKSFELLVKKSGLVIQNVIFDSTDFQFWGSEQYKRDIPLRSEDSYSVNPKKSMFTKRQIIEFKKMAEKLNRQKQGDQAAFYLVRRV